MLAAAAKAGRVREIPGLTEAMSAHERAMDTLDREPLIAEEKARRRAEAEAALQQHVSTLVEQARARALREFDQQEDQLRASARATGADASEADVRSQVFRATRAQHFAALADRAATPGAARQAFADALLTQDADTIRLTGLAVTQRLEALAARDRGKDNSPARNAMLAFQGEFTRWQRANPSATEQLAHIERGRGQMAILLEESARFAMDLFGVGRVAPPPRMRPVPDISARDSVRVGPAFDLLDPSARR